MSIGYCKNCKAGYNARLCPRCGDPLLLDEDFTEENHDEDFQKRLLDRQRRIQALETSRQVLARQRYQDWVARVKKKMEQTGQSFNQASRSVEMNQPF